MRWHAKMQYKKTWDKKGDIIKMKKVLLIAIIAAMTITLLFAGCAKTPAEKEMEELADVLDQMEDLQDFDDEDMQEILDGVDEDALANNDSGQSVSGGKTPGEAYGRFIDAKGIGYDSLSDQIDDNEMLTMTAGIELLALAMVDLEAIALTLVTDDLAASEVAGNMLGMQEFSIKSSGESFSLSYKGMQGETFAAEGKYDKATDSLTSIWTKDGVETLTLEFVQYKDGYAGQYFITSDEGTSSIIKVIVDGQDIAVGMDDADSKPSSIYKSAPNGFDFVMGCSTMFVLQDGQGVSTMEGVETLF